MSQLSFEFTAVPPTPAPAEVNPTPTPDFIPETPKKLNRRRAFRQDLARLSWFSFILKPTMREALVSIHRWCQMAWTEGVSVEQIENLRQAIVDIYAGRTACDSLMESFQRTVVRHNIPAAYPLAFLSGLAMDLSTPSYDTLDDLLGYAYNASGSVSLMMAHVLEVSHQGALKNACDKGLAAQLTNIARNVREDFEQGRVYLPLSWLAEESVLPENIFIPKNRAAVWRVVVRLLEVGDRLYASGNIGLRFLAVRPALSIGAAGRVHAESGRRLVRMGSAALDCPTVASPASERVAAILGMWPVFRQIPSRIRSPWKRSPIHLVWEESQSKSISLP